MNYLSASPIFHLLILFCASCTTPQQAIVAERLVHDTVRLQQVHYDSVFVDRWTSEHTLHDTVFRDRVQTEYRLRLRHDTLYVSRRDTVPVMVPVDRPTRYTPRPVKALAIWGLGSFITLIIIGLWKSRRLLRIFV